MTLNNTYFCDLGVFILKKRNIFAVMDDNKKDSSYVNRLFYFAFLFSRVMTILIISSFFFRTMSDNGKNSSIEKIKRLFHKKSTDIQQLKGNKNQSPKEGNLGGKKPDEKKSVKGQDLPEKKKESAEQPKIPGKRLQHRKPSKGQHFPGNKKESAEQPNLPGKELGHKNSPKGQDLKRNKNKSAEQAKFPGNGLGDKNLTKGQNWPEKKKKSPRQPNFLDKGLEYKRADLPENKKNFNPQPKGGSRSLRNQSEAEKKPTKGQEPHHSPRQQENKKESAEQPNLPGKELGHKNSPKSQEPHRSPRQQENKKESAGQPNLPSKELEDKHSPKAQKPHRWARQEENKKESAKQPNLSGQGVGDKNSPKGPQTHRWARQEENKKESAKQPNLPGKELGHKNSPKGQDLPENENPGINPNSLSVKFTNFLMRDGKKTKALSTLSKSLKLFKKYVENLLYDDQVKQNLVNTQNNKSTLDYLDQAVLNIKPSLEVRKKKISGIMRQIPSFPSSRRKETLAIRWIIEFARKRKNKNSKPFHQCLAEELLDAYQSQGEGYKRKRALHKTAESNRTYMRHRWW